MIELEHIGSELPHIAREAIASYIVSGKRIRVGRPGLPQAAVFVTLRSPNGELRGCIGSLTPTEPDLFVETERSAVLAATRDPRFPPVTIDELPKLSIEVSVLSPREPIASVAELDPTRFGVIVRDAEGRQGLLLPDVPGIHDAETQVTIARRKGGIVPGAPITMWRFTTSKFESQGGRSRV